MEREREPSRLLFQFHFEDSCSEVAREKDEPEVAAAAQDIRHFFVLRATRVTSDYLLL